MKLGREEAYRLLQKYPTRFPVIVKPAGRDLDLRRKKYLVPDDITLGQFLYVLRKHIDNLSDHEGLYIFINGHMFPANALMIHIYTTEQRDYALYVTICKENTFGGFDEIECPICLEIVTNAIETPCGHFFCADCIAKWQEKEPERPHVCPSCMQRVPNVVSYILEIEGRDYQVLGSSESATECSEDETDEETDDETDDETDEETENSDEYDLDCDTTLKVCLCISCSILISVGVLGFVLSLY